MRIVCQKCSAAYAIDDKLVTPRGIRAQCPRCRHLQLVKKGEEGAAVASSGTPIPAPAPPAPPMVAPPAAPPAPSAASPFLFDLGSPPGPATSPSGAASAGGIPGGFNFDFAPPGPPTGAPPGPSAPSPFDFGATPASGAGSPFDFSGDPSPQPLPNASPQAFDFGGTQPPPPITIPGTGELPPDKSAFDFGNTPSGSTVPAAGTQATCRSCGKVLTDPFDQALGTCDECRTKQQTHEVDDTLPDSDSGRVERVEGASKLSARGDAQPIFAPPSAAEKKAARTALREGAYSGGRGKMIAGILAAVVVVGGLGYAVYKRPWARRVPPRVVKGPAPVPRPIEALIKQWKMTFPELEGETSSQAAKHLDAGDEHLMHDTTPEYLEATEEFEKALVLDPSSDRAIAGWILALSFGHAGSIDPQLAQSAEAMLDAAEQRSGDPKLYVAHAHFLIARRGNANDIQVMAERGKNSPNASDKALANLALGQTYLAKNPAMAGTAFAEALRQDPKLKRTLFFQAQLAASAGRYREATEILEKRLTLDANQWEASQELARLYVEVGELGRAKKVLEAAKTAAARSARPKLALAVLAYQHAGELAAGIEQLNALVADKDLPKAEAAEAWVHLASAQRVSGDLAKATEAVQHAQEQAPDSVPARLQHFLVMLDKGVNSQARLDIDGLKGKLNDPGLEAALEGRLLVAEGHFDEASTLLAKAAEADPRRADALLLAGAAAAKAKKDGRAWELCLKQGTRVDPASYPVPAMTLYYVRPADILKPATGAYAALTTGSEEDPNPELCEGLVAWFSEDYRSAETRFNRVNAIDPKNAEAYAYRALLTLRRKDVAGSLRLSARGVDSSRSSALAHYAEALGYLASNKPDLAKAEATSAEKNGPQLVGPKVVRGEVEARQKNTDEARRVLTSVLLSDPLFRDAKRVLYRQSL